jgi:hypothetical protein
MLVADDLSNQKIHHVELHFVTGFFRKSAKNPIFLSIVLTTDEAGFTEMELSIRIIPISGREKIHTKPENVVSNKDFKLTCARE